MMNFSWVFLVGLALSGAVSVKGGPARLGIKNPQSELHEVFKAFYGLWSGGEFQQLFENYLINDAEFNADVGYLYSDEFKDVVKKIESIDDFIDFVDYLEEAGLQAYGILNELHYIFEIPSLKSGRRTRSVKITGGIAGYIADYKAILPIDKIQALHQEKLETSPAFARFVAYWKSPHFQKIIDALRANDEFQGLLNDSKKGGVDLEAIVDLYAAKFGLEFPSRRVVKRSAGLDEDLREFTELVHTKEYQKIFKEYLMNDKGFNEAIQFIFSDAFKDLVVKIESLDDLRNLFDYLKEAGLDAYAVVNQLHVIFEIPPLKSGRRSRSVEITGGADGFLADYKGILPIDQIEALHQKKLESSPAFARFVDYWQSPRFLELINALRANEEFQGLLNIAKEGGIDLMAIVDLYATMLGLEIPSSSQKNL